MFASVTGSVPSRSPNDQLGRVLASNKTLIGTISSLRNAEKLGIFALINTPFGHSFEMRITPKAAELIKIHESNMLSPAPRLVAMASTDGRICGTQDEAGLKGGMPSSTSPPSRDQFISAIKNAFTFETCSRDDRGQWAEHNKSRGHCAMAAMAVHEIFGGELYCAKVTDANTGKVTGHWFNKIDGQNIDLTGDQFFENESVDFENANQYTKEILLGLDTYAEQYNTFKLNVRNNLQS